MPTNLPLAALPLRARDAYRAGSSERWSRSLVLICALALALVVLQVVMWYGGVASRGGLDKYVRRVTDFTATLTGALLIRNGDGALLYDFDAQRAAQAQVAPLAAGATRELVLIYVHPPAEALAVAPLLALPYGQLFALWTAASVVAFALALWLLCSALRLRGPVRLALISAACAYHPVHHALWLGQNSPFVLLGLCGVYWAWNTRRDGWLAAALVLLAVKPQIIPLIVLLLALQQRWRALLGAAVGGGALVIAAMPLLGPQWPSQYANFVLNVSHAETVGEQPLRMHNWRGLLLNLFGGASPAFVTFLVIGISCATIGAVAWAGWHLRNQLPMEGYQAVQGDLLFAFACLAAVLVSPHQHVHDLIILVVPAWLIAVHAARGAWTSALSRAWVAVLWCGWLVPLVTLFATTSDAVATVTSVIFIIGVALLLFWQLAQGLTKRLPLHRAA